MKHRLSNFILRYIGADGLMHFSISAIAVTLLDLFLPLWLAIALTLICAAGKEVYDLVTKKGTAEWKDWLCDLAGVIIGML